VGLLKFWNSLPDDMPEDIKQARTQDELLKLVDEMAEVLEAEEEIPELRETELDIEKMKNYAFDMTVDVDVGADQKLYLDCKLGVSRAGKFIYFIGYSSLLHNNDNVVARRGNIICFNNTRNMITSVEPRYVGESLRYYVLTTENMDA
jgi:hypothetical protein